MTQPYGNFTDPVQEFYLAKEREVEALNERFYNQFATRQNADALIAASTIYPGASSPLLMALAQGGIAAGTPLADQIVYEEFAQRPQNGPISQPGEGWWDNVWGVLDEAVVDPLAGTLRWTFSAWDALWNLGPGGAPIRAAQMAANQNISFGEAWQAQDPYFFEALGGLVQGEKVNLGQGIFPQSDVAPSVEEEVSRLSMEFDQQTENLPANERYVQRLQQAPQIWRQAVANNAQDQAEFGKPLTQMNYADTEAVMFNMAQGRTPWSPGRIIAANIVEPGTRPFHAISGTGDFAAQVFLDPAEWIGIGWARHGRHGRRIYGVVNRMFNDADTYAMPGKVPYGPNLSDATGTALAVRHAPAEEIRLAKPQIGLPAGDEAPKLAHTGVRYGYEPSTPWFVSGVDPAPVVRPTDPPQWWIDAADAQRAQARYPLGAEAPVFRRMEAGVYRADLPTLPGTPIQPRINIVRRGTGKGQHWVVKGPDNQLVGRMPDDPRFSTPETQFRTLNEAKQVANDEIARYQAQDIQVGGMTSQEFLDSGEDFYLRIDTHSDSPLSEWGGYNRRRSTNATRKSWRGARRKDARPDLRTRKAREDFPAGGTYGKVSGIRARVFGRTIDLSDDAKVDDLPLELRAALREDGRLTRENGRRVLKGTSDADFQNTLRWAENNGVGKIVWDEDDVLLVDRFFGGNPDDPLGRVWYDSPDIPIGGRTFVDSPTQTTAGEVDSFLGGLADDIDNILMDMAESRFPNDFDRQAYLNWVETRGATTGLSAEDAARVAEQGRQMRLMLNEVADEFAGLPRELRRDVVNERYADLAGKLDQFDDVNMRIPPEWNISNVVRPDWDPRFELRGKRSGMFLERLRAGTRMGGQKDYRVLDDLLAQIETRHVKIPNSVRRELFEATDERSLESIFVRWLTSEGPQEILLPGGAQFGRLAAAGIRMPSVGLVDRPWWQRRFAMALDNSEFNLLEDPAEAYHRFTTALPHYNIQRGEVINLVDEQGNLTGATVNIEDILRRVVNLDPNSTNKAEGFRIMEDFSQALFAKAAAPLSEGGANVDPALAKHVARWFRESAEQGKFEADRLQMPSLTDGPYDATIVKNALVGGVGPDSTAALWTGALGALPDPRTLKRVMNNSDAVGRIANQIALKVIDEGGEGAAKITRYQERTLVRWYDNFITKIWKPFVLLRGAWTLRILMDDQFRMAADGYSMFNHPLRVLNYAMTSPDDWRDAFRRGYVDVFGTRFKVDDINEMHHAEFFRSALMSRPDDARLGPGAYGRQQFEFVGRGDTKYIEGLAFENEMMASSPLMKVLADSSADDPVEEAVNWLRGRGPRDTRGGGQHEYENVLSMFARGEGNQQVARAIQEGDDEVLRMVVQRQYAALHHRTGGTVRFAPGDGRIYDYRGTPVGMDNTAGTGPRWIVESQGDADLLDYIGKTSITRSRTPKVHEQLKRRLRTKVDNAPDRFPKEVRTPKAHEQTALPTNDWDNAVRGFYTFFMTTPSDTLSRIPEFRRAYWEKIADMYPYMDERLQAEFLNKLPMGEIRRALDNAKKRPGVTGQITYSQEAFSHLDELGKAHGLTMVEATLFDLVNKRNISDSLRLVFPFIEAWGEFITRWGRMLVTGDRNIANARRLQQIMEGARENDPFAMIGEGEQEHGFFYENQFGQEVFNYPAFMSQAHVALHNTLNNLPVVGQALGGDVTAETAEAAQMRGSVESLNFAAGVIPGFGPVFQLGAKHFIPEDPRWDWVRDMVAPFGTEGGALGMMAPAWVKRIVSAYGGNGDPQLDYTYTATVVDVIRTMIDRGDFAGVTSQEEINELIEQAENEAKGLLMVRAAATWWNPTAPSIQFQKEDRTGMMWSYSNLGQEYRKLVEETGSDAAAFDTFYARFGFLPQAFRGGKTYRVIDRSLTEEGSRFQRANPDLFNRYSGTGMYLDPNIDEVSDYDHESLLRQLRLGEREGWTAEQFIYIQQDQLGDLWWDHANRQAILIEDRPTRNAFLAEQRAMIESKYPYWRKPVPGKKQAVTNEDQMAEVNRWFEDDSLSGSPVVEAAREYEAARQEVLGYLAPLGATTIDGPSSMDSDAGREATMGRAYLRELADRLKMRTPEFGPLFDNVYAWEVSERNDAPEPITPDLYPVDDPLELAYGG